MTTPALQTCTNLNADGTRRQIRAALDAGASRDEILMVLKMASLLSIHSCSLGAPILLEEAKAATAQPASRPGPPPSTPACDKIRAMGPWNEANNPFFELDPVWIDEFMAPGAGVYASGVLAAKEVELLSIAFDASYTHMYAPGARRHIKAALKLGRRSRRSWRCSSSAWSKASKPAIWVYRSSLTSSPIRTGSRENWIKDITPEGGSK
jgi:alkylhydroperoxidase/carboxymuconolactone decarboxylase family protein YurZ